MKITLAIGCEIKVHKDIKNSVKSLSYFQPTKFKTPASYNVMLRNTKVNLYK